MRDLEKDKGESGRISRNEKPWPREVKKKNCDYGITKKPSTPPQKTPTPIHKTPKTKPNRQGNSVGKGGKGYAMRWGGKGGVNKKIVNA